MKLGEIIKEYREKTGMSQRQFATACKISNGYISMLENGINPKTQEPITPSIFALKDIAAAMHVPLHDLMASCDDMPVEMPTSVPCFALTDKEKRLVEAYRLKTEMQGAVDTLLGIE